MSQSQTPPRRPIAWRAAFDVTATVIVIVLAAVVAWQTRSGVSTEPARKTIAVPAEPVSIADAPSDGSPTAKAAIIEYSDFQCPYCARTASGILKTLQRDYVASGRVVRAFKNLPLPLHAAAHGAAEAALCAHGQGRFWDMHEALFANQSKLPDLQFGVLAAQLGLNVSHFESCRSEGATAKRVDADKTEAAALGITSTPTFLIGAVLPNNRVRVTHVLVGAKPIGEFTDSLERLLAQR